MKTESKGQRGEGRKPNKMDTGRPVDISRTQRGVVGSDTLRSPSGCKIDLKVLVGGIERLLREMSKVQSNECGYCKALVNLALAEREIRAGHRAKAVEHLKKAGKPVLDVAAKMGMYAIVDAIRVKTE